MNTFICLALLALTEAHPIENQASNGYAESIWEINQAVGVSENVIQGDILLTREQLAELNENKNETVRTKRQAVTYGKWPGSTLYYYFDSSFGSYGRPAVQKALKYISDRTCVNFVENAGAQNRVKVRGGAGIGCLSFVGMGGGEQELLLGQGCERVGTAAHEFMHALGFIHTAQRPDRDSYFSVNMGAISNPLLASNLNIYTTGQTINYVPYEYGSVMHCASNTMGANTITARDARYLYTMGGELISFYDIKMINDHYGCSSRCGTGSAQCRNGGTPNPRNCATCNCPLGYAGTLCDQRPTGCGEALTATSQWQTKQYSFGDFNSILMRMDFDFCNHWITAPAGQKVQVKITQLFNAATSFGCPNNGMEIKLSNPQQTNPRHCSQDAINQEFTSDLNPTPVISYNKLSYSTFTFQYRAVAGGSPGTNPGTPGTGSCVDTSTSCSTWIANSNFCGSTYYTQDEKRSYCAKSCNLCSTQPQPACVDADYSCATWIANSNFCGSTFYTTEQKRMYCAASCRLC